MEILKQLKADGRSIVLSTHILADMEKVCDKVGFLHNGVIKNEIRVSELLSGEQDSWEIEFEAELEFPVHNKTALCVTPIGEKSYLFETADQKYILQYLASLPNKIVSIRNKAISLDELFKEVCK
jgi:ABC-2 type transport system ATP-binding protein